MTDPIDLETTLEGLDLAVPSRLARQLEEAVQGDFEIVRLIARGGMGLVFLAEDLTLLRQVAIKVLLADTFTTKSEVRRFQQEARTIAALDHPNIVPVYSVREHEDLLLYIMQFVDGQTLEQVIAEGPIAPEQVLSIVAMVADALDHAHAKNIVHRDVKPANVIVDQRGRAYVMDFGIAQVPEQQGLTVAGSLVGTPKYASPEQCRAEPARPQSDQYSLGLVAYEMLTGSPPFASNTVSGIIRDHLHTAPPRLADTCPGCPEALAHAVQRMLMKAPEARWPNLSEAVAYAAEGSSSYAYPLGVGLTGLTPPLRSPSPRSGSDGEKAVRVEAPTYWTDLRLGPLLAASGVLLGVALFVVFGTDVLTPAGRPLEAGGGPRDAAGAQSPDTTDPAVAVLLGGTASSPVNEAPEAASGGTGDDRAAGETSPSSGPADAATGVSAAASVRPTPPERGVDAGAFAIGAAAPPLDPEPGTVLLGTRGLAAVLYVDDVPQGAASRLRSWEMAAGEVRLSLRVDGCPVWDSTVLVPAGGEIRLGYRLQSCRSSGAGR